VPIEIGLPGLVCVTARLVVFGPDNVPAITDPAEAADDVTLAVFSALTHSRRPDVSGILEALATALATIDEESAANLAEFTETGLGDTAGRQIWRALMATRTFPFVSEMRLQARDEGREEGREAGRAEGLAAAIVKVLERRGIEVDDASRARIVSCGDGDTLDVWLDRSVVVASAGELFA
jgi:predicted transposase YdaD